MTSIASIGLSGVISAQHQAARHAQKITQYGAKVDGQEYAPVEDTIAQDVVGLMQAEHVHTASVKLITVNDEMQKELLDIIA